MAAVTVSPKYQIVIPREIRERMGIRPGQKVALMPFGGKVVLVPIRPMKEMRGFLKGIDTTIERDEEWRE
ncbi:MAG: AbrB/MazE/SpoVT family DNA-binding domain-containing protein [Planctomycetes bacterium]|nr:AbrB/MazE/SpoVT family DNA-binding domain-containing protein [Planctomycetota bacterium]